MNTIGSVYNNNGQLFSQTGLGAEMMGKIGGITGNGALNSMHLGDDPYAWAQKMGWMQPVSQQPTDPNASANASASAKAKQDAFQAYINRLSMQANNALYGGLLGGQNQPIQSGSVGGNLTNGGLLNINSAPQGSLGQFAQRPWMTGGM